MANPLRMALALFLSAFTVGLPFLTTYLTFAMMPLTDAYLPTWLRYLITGSIVMFSTPFVMGMLMWMVVGTMHVYTLWKRINTLVFGHPIAPDYIFELWPILSKFWLVYGKLFHSMEIIGIENIPKCGPGLLIFYHGVLPLDYFYLVIHMYSNYKRMFRTVADKFFFKIPSLQLFIKLMNIHSGTIDTCTKFLKDGELVAIAPGGAREALLGDSQYQTIWNNRTGFARVAIDAKSPIIPMFCVNIRQAYLSFPYFRSFFRRLYDETRLPVLPVYGCFPVKMKVIIGKPIEYDPSVTPEQLAKKVEQAIQDMIQEHQQIPKTILGAICDRFVTRTIKSE